MTTMRLDKFLSNMGEGSRKDVRKLLRAGAVTVDGKITKQHDLKIDADANEIRVYGEIIEYKKYVYIMMNKPAGYITATSDDDPDVRFVTELLPEELAYTDAFPVGRLDKDTVGLLLLTNDGIFSHRTLSPKKHVEKEYFARVTGKVDETDVAAFLNGVTLEDGYKCRPAKLEILQQGDVSEVKVIIIEGKFHQIKRMFQAVGKTVTFLKRTSFGGITLDPELPEGSCRELNAYEMEIIKDYVAID